MMSAPVVIELDQLLPPEIFERLQAEADRQRSPLDQVVREAIETYLENPDEDTPDAKILTDLRAAWREALTGQTISADEVLAALRENLKRE